jgi:MFS family permease
VSAAVLTGVGIAIFRLKNKRSILQIAGGLVGVAISAVITLSSHQARGFFLYGMILNAVYGSAFIVSLLFGRPLVGYLVGAATGDITGWLKDKQLRRVYAAATWIWVFVFAIRLVVRVPLYLANAVGWLGITGIAMGWPLYLLAAWFTYLLLAPVLKAKREREKAVGVLDEAEAASAADEPEAEPDGD